MKGTRSAGSALNRSSDRMKQAMRGIDADRPQSTWETFELNQHVMASSSPTGGLTRGPSPGGLASTP
ncbi:hypothetical protein BD626DRAFT_506735 [Schizophyllum amplum]|uniref:Uncharacterized protein n=1 Tax=Schizophyllum amplum TaxID=97359 RepID=A0A550C4Z5_9AGAR|nr:hypothetical protein BD626DRAFT_506735 [Auriculariopsis ampla]